jgi:hypothetical protein
MGKTAGIRQRIASSQINDRKGQALRPEVVLDGAGAFSSYVLDNKDIHAFSPFSADVKKINAMPGLRDDSVVTKWMLENTYPCAVQWFRITSIDSSVTVHVSTTL